MYKSIVRIIMFVFCIMSINIVSIYASDTLKDRIIILDAGHGINYNVYDGYDEGKTMMNLVLKIKPLLEAKGATVYLTHETQEGVSLVYRSAFTNKIVLETLLEINESKLQVATSEEKVSIQGDINEINELLPILNNLCLDPETYGPIYTNTPYDYSYEREMHPDLKRILELQNDVEVGSRFLFISFHSNATGVPINQGANGVDCFIPNNERAYYTEYSYMKQCDFIANKMVDAISALGFRRNRVTKDDLHVLRETNIPAILVENGFHTNGDDRAKLQNESVLEQLAVTYAICVEEYFASDIVPEIPYTNEIAYTNEWATIIDNQPMVIPVPVKIIDSVIFVSAKEIFQHLEVELKLYK